MNIDFSTWSVTNHFKQQEVPTQNNIVYVLYYIKPDEAAEIPFYVGESTRHLGRLGDYLSAKFSASTDFKVGVAIRQFRSLGFQVGIKYRESSKRRDDEKEVIKQLRQQFKLLNDLPGYDYKRSNEEEQIIIIQNFVSEIIQYIEPSQRDKVLSSLNTGQMKKFKPTSKKRKKQQPCIAERIEAICEKLGANGQIIKRKEIIDHAKRIGINEFSVLPADYCDNTLTGKWSSYSFLHSVDRGRYVLRRFSGKTKG